MPRSTSPRLSSFGIAAAVALGASAFAFTSDAQARPNITRKGGQWGVMLGGSACVPGKAECQRDEIDIDGRTRPSFGTNAELGYRFNKWVFFGASYHFGLFNMDYEVSGADGLKRGYQHSIYALVRPTLPVWRFDFGLGLGPGYSRQVFVRDSGDKDYTQGFSFVLSPTIDIFVSQRIFLGAKFDLLLNAHGQVCERRDDTATCRDVDRDTDVAPVHQMLFGLHVGGTFL